MRLRGLLRHGMPRGSGASAAVVVSHIGRKTLHGARQRKARDVARTLAAELVFFELTRRNFGWNSMLRSENGFFPHIFMPDYHGPHFDEAVRRLVFPNRGPNILYFSLTGNCPCHCEYCFAGAGGPDSPDVGDEVVQAVAEKVASLRIPLVNISGGEPLVRPERLMRAVRTLSRGCEVRLFTTGFGLTAERLRELRDAGLKGVFVSLDTVDPAVFDSTRGRPGAFDSATNALRLCARSGMLTFVNNVVNRQRFRNDADIERFFRFIAAIDPRIAVNFLPQLATGRGAEAESFRHPEECQELGDRIVEIARRMRRPASMLFGTVDRFIGCPGAGGKLMNLDIQGNVTVCISRAALGNVLEEPFSDIYARFVSACDRLKVGFFCCEVAEKAEGSLLEEEESARALDAFYARTPDAVWQQMIDRHGWLIGNLFPA